MLKLGDKTINKICLGDKVFSKVCLGDKLVFQDSKPIFLDYVALDANSWINTGFKPNPYTTRVVLDFMLLDGATQNQPIFGSRPTNGATIDSFNVLYNNAYLAKKLRLDCTGDYSVATSNLTANTRITLDCHNNKVIVNGTTYTSKVDKSSCTYSEFEMYLGNINSAGSAFSTGCKIRVYGWSIYDDGTLVQDLRPSIDSNGVVCFYDLVTKKYFYNQGTGQFKAGGRFVKSILFDGASFVDTGIIPTNNTGAYCKLVSSAKDQTFLGSRNDAGETRLGLICTNNTYIGFGRGYYLYLNQDGSIVYKDVSDRVSIQMNNPLELWSNFNNDKKLRVKQGEIDVTGQPIKDVSFTPQFTMFLGGMNISGVHKSACTGKVLQCQITEGNTLLLDLRPFVDENEVACFYDIVTGTKFYNQGTGTLGYTE